MAHRYRDTIFDLSGRTALITGGGRGLGKAMAHQLAEAGAEVLLASRSEDELAAAAEEIRTAMGSRIEYAVADLARRDDAVRLADEALSKMGRIDILVNNAGANVPQPIDQVRDEDWDRLLELNLSSCMALSRALVPGMKERRWGRVVHISSIMGLASTAGRNAYSATKAALVGMTRAMALDLGPFEITVNAIAPGPFATEMPMSILSEEQKRALGDRTALGRWGRADELCGTALLLASNAGSYITGTCIVVDGGALSRVF